MFSYSKTKLLPSSLVPEPALPLAPVLVMEGKADALAAFSLLPIHPRACELVINQASVLGYQHPIACAQVLSRVSAAPKLVCCTGKT